MWDPYAEFQSTTLPNGLTVHAAHWPGRTWEVIAFVIHSGAEHDPIGLEGLSHFVEHLVSKNGTVSAREICVLFEDCGGTVRLGATGYPHTYYQFFVPIHEAILTKAFSIFGHMLLSARLEKSIEKERQIIGGEFHRRYPFRQQFDLAMREHHALYTGHWLDRIVCPIGDLDSIGRITQGDLQSHYNAHYTPANMSIVGVGGMQLSELVKLLFESPFAVKKDGVRTPLPTLMTDVKPPSETRYILEMSKYLNVPVEICVYRSVAKIPGNINRQIIRVTRNIFDEILDEEVREKRAWTYAINSAQLNFRDFSRFSICCGAFKLEALDQIEKVIEECIASIKHREDLLERFKRHILASKSMIDLTGNEVCNGAINDLGHHQRIIPLSETSNDFESVTMDDVRNLLPWLQSEKRWTLITRP